jgi:hypothetical protein
MFQNLHEAIELIREGGLQVMTLLPEEGHMDLAHPASTDQYQGKVFDRQGIRTLIQLDADHVTILSPVVLSMPELLKKHSEAVHEKLGIFQRIQGWFHHGWIPIFIVFEIFSVFILGFIHEWGVVNVAVLATLGGGCIVFLQTWLARVSLRLALQLGKYYARYRFKRFVSKQLKGLANCEK